MKSYTSQATIFHIIFFPKNLNNFKTFKKSKFSQNIFFPSSDKIKLDFVRSAFKSETSTSSTSNGHHLPCSSPLNPQNSSESDDDEELEGACALPLKKEPKPPKDFEDLLQVETAKILELFSDLGTGYIRKLLAFYDNSSEKVIEKIVEGKNCFLKFLIYFFESF
jgi:hypothetical protein